jgi:hypothetical protein
MFAFWNMALSLEKNSDSGKTLVADIDRGRRNAHHECDIGILKN